ncbi:hypothetical protein JXA48_03075 [Candidatus Woesearchaeota archaeon]|nr:hypothetical protein [Candidatus Woesearchaeota archaeon]
MIVLISFIILVIVEVLVILLAPAGIYKEISLTIFGILIGATGLSMKDIISDIKLRKKTKNDYKTVAKNLQDFFAKSLPELEIPRKFDESATEKEIVDSLLKSNIQGITSDFVHIITLCYYCKKWELDKSPINYESIKQISESLGIKYSHVNKDIKNFAKIYNQLIIKKVSIDLSENITEKEVKEVIINFITNYYKDLQFFEIKDKFHQNKNLHETLIKIIKEGKLSTYGITEETIKKLNQEITKKAKSSNTFVLFTNNTNPTDRNNLKEYLHKFSRLGMSGGTTQMPIYARFGVYIIKTETFQTAKSLLKDIKNSVEISSEAIIRIVPLDLLNSETYTLPFNQSFSNENLKKCYNALEWFKLGYDYSDSVLWSEITKSSITPHELLSVIPFNIFCEGILPCEREFIISNYQQIKTHFEVETLSDWASKDADLLTAKLIELGKPSYSPDQIKITLKSGTNLDEKISKRLKKISNQIITGAKEFNKTLNPTES